MESLARETKGAFHWYPVQKTFTIVAPQDTFKFAIGIPYMARNGRSIDLSAAPELKDGHLWIAEEDAKKVTSKAATITAETDRKSVV